MDNKLAFMSTTIGCPYQFINSKCYTFSSLHVTELFFLRGRYRTCQSRYPAILVSLPELRARTYSITRERKKKEREVILTSIWRPKWLVVPLGVGKQIPGSQNG